ncbi:MAG: GspH/FimT family pseudopilin, partial [Aeromonas sp.]
MDVHHQPTRGFTLLELMLVIALVSVLLAIALPSYRDLRQTQRLRAATQAVYTDMMLLKANAVKRGQNLSLIIFNGGSANWCYRIAVDAASCNSCADSCASLDGRMGSDAAEFSGINLAASYAPVSLNRQVITFGVRRSGLPAGNITLTSGDYGLRVLTNNLGRVRTCAVNNK